MVIKYFQPFSVNTLSAHEQITTLGTQVDMVVVDCDILKDTGNSREVRHISNIYEDLRLWWVSNTVWTATGNRSALDEDVIEAKVSESYQKIMTKDFVMSLSRK